VGNLEVFTAPEIGVRYIIGGDTAEGLAHGDAQVLYVINHKTEECVAIYRSQVAPDELATEAYKLGKYYNWALVGIEVNKDGLWVNDALEKLGYVNLYYRKVFDDITQKITKFFGWKTTSSTRPFALAALKAVFFRKDSGFPAALLSEMFTFVRNIKGKPEAMDKKFDDVIMAASIAYAILGEQPAYVDNSAIGEGTSHMKMIFGEDQQGVQQINH
jgi:phage terminase large subunit